MKTLSMRVTLLALVSCACLATSAVRAAPDEAADDRAGKAAVRVTVELLDGSRIVGTPGLKTLPLTLEFAKVDVPLHLLTACDLRHKEQVAVITFANGDRLTGRIGLDELPMESSVGRIAPKLEQVSRLSFSTLRAGPMPPGNAGVPFGGVNWLTWRTGFEVRGDRLVSLPAAREGFRYGHDGHGRGPLLVTNVGSRQWRDYRVEVTLGLAGVDPAFNPYGLAPDFRSGGILFHVADVKESHNDRGMSAYCFSVQGDGSWRLESVINAFCDQPVGFGNPREDSRRPLAEGRGIQVDPQRGNRFSLAVTGKRILIHADGAELVDLVDERMDELVGEQTLDHGGVAFIGGFDAMIWIEDFSAIAL